MSDYGLKRAALEVGLSEAETNSLRLLTHDASVPYMDYCLTLSVDLIARHVKIADLTHNLDSSRMGGKPSPKAKIMQERLALLRDRDS